MVLNRRDPNLFGWRETVEKQNAKEDLDASRLNAIALFSEKNIPAVRAARLVVYCQLVHYPNYSI